MTQVINIKQVETQEQLDARIEQQGYIAYWNKIVPPCPYDIGTNGRTQWQKGLDRAADYEAEQRELDAKKWEEINLQRALRIEQAAEDLRRRTEKQKRNKANRDARAEANRAARMAKSKGK